MPSAHRYEPTGRVQLSCSRCGLTLYTRPRLSVDYCPRCIARSRVVSPLVAAPGALAPS